MVKVRDRLTEPVNFVVYPMFVAPVDRPHRPLYLLRMLFGGGTGWGLKLHLIVSRSFLASFAPGTSKPSLSAFLISALSGSDFAGISRM